LYILTLIEVLLSESLSHGVLTFLLSILSPLPTVSPTLYFSILLPLLVPSPSLSPLSSLPFQARKKMPRGSGWERERDGGGETEEGEERKRGR
jgi:hypothetical protein